MASLSLRPIKAHSLPPPPSSTHVITHLLLLLLLCVSIAAGQGNCNWHGKAGITTTPLQLFRVDPSGLSGNFTTVQSAIDAVPQNNQRWVCIYVKEGIYREKVVIPYDKPFIVLRGRGKRKTEIVWDDHASLAQSPTFTSLADNIVVKSMSFRNSYNNPVNQNPWTPAAAAMVVGDKSYFYRVGFWGFQDTLWDVQGRHYFNRCTIQGAIDFIFGGGQSIYEGCAISVLANALGPMSVGYITAQGRENPQDPNGFVFKNCNVFGFGKALLGRPWRPYARVLFYYSNFTSVVDPQGWDSWITKNTKQLTFAEYGCYGPGAAMSGRVDWEKKLDVTTVQQLTSLSFIDSEGWLANTPY